METKKTHGGARAGSGRTKENAVPYKTTLPEDKLETFLRYYPKIELNKALRKIMDEKIAYAEENMHDLSWSKALGIPQDINKKKPK